MLFTAMIHTRFVAISPIWQKLPIVDLARGMAASKRRAGLPFLFHLRDRAIDSINAIVQRMNNNQSPSKVARVISWQVAATEAGEFEGVAPL